MKKDMRIRRKFTENCMPKICQKLRQANILYQIKKISSQIRNCRNMCRKREKQLLRLLRSLRSKTLSNAYIEYGKIPNYTLAEFFYYICYLWIINYYVKSQSNNLSNENINTGVSVVFKTKRELKCQNELFLKYHFSGNTSLYVFITEII